MRFLSDGQILEEVCKLIRQEGNVMAAVAYWGRGAKEQTGITLKKNGSVKILCDLFSGACNPDEIEKLVKSKRVEVRTLDGMHAKVWLNGFDTIIGSANTSTNGLGFEGGHNNIEAAMYVHNERIARDTEQWFEEQWGCAVKVEEDHLKSARNFWETKQGQIKTGRAKTQTLLGKIRKDNSHNVFSNLRIIAYEDQSVSREAEEKWRDRKKFHYSEDELKRFGDYWPFYEATESKWRPSKSTIFMDYSCSKKGKDFVFGELWKVRDPSFIELANGGHLILLSQIEHVEGYRFPPLEQKEVAGMVKCWVNDHKLENDKKDIYFEIPFSEFWENSTAQM